MSEQDENQELITEITRRGREIERQEAERTDKIPCTCWQCGRRFRYGPWGVLEAGRWFWKYFYVLCPGCGVRIPLAGDPRRDLSRVASS